jgi:hypothetical protein
MARFMRTDLGPHHSQLHPPAVVGQGIVFPPIYGVLTPVSDAQIATLRRRGKSTLRPPRVVTQPVPFIQLPLNINLTPKEGVWRRNNQRTVQFKLFPPAVVGAGIVSQRIRGRLHPVGTVATLVRQRRPESLLRPPTVVNTPVVFIGAPATTLAPSTRLSRASHSHLRGPVVVDARSQTKYLSINLTYSRRGAPESRLRPPTVVASAVRVAPVSVHLAYSRRGVAHGYLGRPVVTFDTVRFFGPTTKLAYSRRGVPKSRLEPPTVVDTRVYSGPAVTLAYSLRGKPRSFLRSPVVIDLSPQTVYLSVSLAYSRRGRPVSFLKPPTVLATGQTFYGPATHLVAVRTRVEQSQHRTIVGIRSPVFVGAGIAFSGPVTTLAPSPRQARKTHSTLRPPVPTTPVDVFGGILVQYVRTPRTTTRSRLGPPATVTVVAQVYYGPKTSLVRIRPRRVVSKLRLPVVVFLAVEIYGPAVRLAYSVRKRGTADLKPPTLIDLRPQVYYLSISLARIRPVPTTKFLSPPTDLVDEQDKGHVRVTLAPSPTQARRTHSRLEPPTVIDNSPQTVYLTVWLAYSRRGAPKSRLEPPTVIDVRVYTGPDVHLAYSVRGAPKSRLEPPAVIDNSPQTVYLSVNLTYSRRGRPLSFLLPPTVVDRRIYFGPEVKLTYSRRGRPIYELRPPTVIDLRPQTYYLSITLAPSRRGRPMHFLRPAILAQAKQFEAVAVHLTYSVRKRGRAVLRRPVVVFPFFARKIKITLAPQSRGKAKSQLLPPAVIRERENKPLTIVFVRIRPFPTVAFLRPPTVVTIPENRATRVTLTRITPPPTIAFLRPPTVVRPPFVALAIQTHLVRIKPVPTTTFIQPPVVVQPFTPPGGDVCGFDIAGSFICFDEEAGSVDSGATAAGSTIVGGDQQSDNIAGGDQPGSSVSGGDQQST